MGAKLTLGVNDLLTRHPELAKEAFGWDPATVTYRSKRIMAWKGACGHVWDAVVGSRSVTGTGCPYCSGRKVLVGFNDLQTVDPELAREALGWDPTQFTRGSKAKVKWQGKCGHVWAATIKNRHALKSNCPYCSNNAVLKGFNDLATLAPDVAKYAHQWDPSTATAWSNVYKKWKCHCGYIWETSPGSMMFSNQIGTNGCHACSRRNFRFNDDAYLYLMERKNDQQIGITNNPLNRFRKHFLSGWKLIEVQGPASAWKIHKRELAIKRWIKKKIGCVEGTRENWYKENLCVSSIAELEWKISHDLAWQLTQR
jgi:predicted  nucleic acid-binding Zn-ribbon protein